MESQVSYDCTFCPSDHDRATGEPQVRIEDIRVCLCQQETPSAAGAGMTISLNVTCQIAMYLTNDRHLLAAAFGSMLSATGFLDCFHKALCINVLSISSLLKEI